MKRDATLILMLAFALGGVVLLSRQLDRTRAADPTYGEDALYLNGRAAKRLTLAFNGLAADWYWMRSLQYVGRKIVGYEDKHAGNFGLSDLSVLDLHLLPSLLRVTTTLDPQFTAAYEYGAVILPEVNPDEAVALLHEGIAANPSSWRLYQHLGYIYWQRKDYDKASETYAAGAKLAGAPAWMMAMAGRMKADRGSRDSAREIYRHLYESSNDRAVKDMVTYHLMRLDWLEDREAIRRVLNAYRERSGRCPASWRDIANQLRESHRRVDAATGSPVDPSGVQYRLINGGCDVDLDERSQVPR